MRFQLVALAALSLGVTIAIFSPAAELLGPRHHCAGGDHCQCPMVEEMVWQNVVRHTCRLVDETKQIKKTVYDFKEVPFCLHKLPHFGHCTECMDCDCVRYKRVLLKREIVVAEECITKCVPEEYIERVLVKVCRPACQCQTPCATKPIFDAASSPAPVVTDDAPLPPVPAAK